MCLVQLESGLQKWVDANEVKERTDNIMAVRPPVIPCTEPGSPDIASTETTPPAVVNSAPPSETKSMELDIDTLFDSITLADA